MKLTTSPGARAGILAGVVIILVIGWLALDFIIAEALADRAVSNSQQQLCSVIRLVTIHPVPKPPDPKANPSRQQSWEFYEAFVRVGNEYHC
jgi:hypothetical protein